MKMNFKKFKIVVVFGTVAILAIFITRPAHSQETAKKESHKKIMLKIVSNDNGKTTMIDTTMEMSDTTMMDSINHEIEKVINISKGGKHGRFKMHSMPRGFNYDFEIPDIPECPMDLDELQEIELEGMDPGREMEDFNWDGRAPRQERRIIRSGGNGQSLNDILGEIPMDRVVNYSIKDRKHGKRIVIDLNDGPAFGKQDRVIVIREPGRSPHPRYAPGRKVKVYVDTDQDDDDMKEENTTDQPVPPSAPPPPPPQKTKNK